MSLYEGIDVGREISQEENKEKKGWDTGLKLLQSHIQLKKASLTTNVKPKVPIVTASVPSKESKRNEGKFSSLSYSSGHSLPFINPVPKDTFFEDLNVEDEYNPMYPNDYERIMKKRDEQKRQLREEERKKEAEDKLKRKHEMTSRDSDEEWEVEDRRENEKRTMGAAIAPPPSLLEDPQKDKEDENSANPSFVPSFGSGSKGLNVAAKIMEKYGYKHGAGLGKLEQGMSTALHVEKTGLRGGKIIHERDIPKTEMFQQPELANESITDVLKNPTKVVLLKNMVGPGEVDEDLEPEVKEEMMKYGDVVSVVIFEMPGQPEEEAVRIFVEFSKMDHAIKAVVSLHGRFFAARSIRASFYDVDKFKQYELAD